MSDQPIPTYFGLWRIVTIVDLPAFFIGALAAIAGHRWGAYVLIANLVLQIGFHLIVGWGAYREVMTREWPNVAPLNDEEWDD